MDFKICFKSDMENDITLDLQIKPADILITWRGYTNNKPEERLG